LHENNPDVSVTLAWVLFQSGQVRQALATLQSAFQKGALSADANYLVAKLLMQRGDNDNAKRFLDAALGFKGIFVQRAEAEALREQLK
jgi:Tfp pilus assembly protein PilF